MKRVIFIAGPYRGTNAWAVEQNIRKAETAAFEIWSMGGVVICPHTNTRFFDGTLTDDIWLDGIRELLRRCDGVYFLPGWECSAGSVLELEHAQEHDVRCFFKMREVEDYINGML